MGCDIHLFVERKSGGEWRSVDEWAKVDEEHSFPEVVYEKQFYNGRNYRLFGVLANVRNGHGFAGVKTGEPVKPIDMPRGLPSNVSHPVKACAAAWDCDGHSHSWFELPELLAYDWTQIMDICGYLSLEQYFEWNGYNRERGHNPEGWSGDISGMNVRKISNQEMEKIIEEFKINGHRLDQEKLKQTVLRYYTFCEWQQPYYRMCSEFLGETLPKLFRVDPDFSKTRIVFWFDN